VPSTLVILALCIGTIGPQFAPVTSLRFHSSSALPIVQYNGIPAITPDGSPVTRALLTSGSQAISASPGESISFTVSYQIWQGANPGELDQLMLIASWTPSWPPPRGYYWGIYTGSPPPSPGVSGSTSLTVTAPSTPGTYYLWFVFDANYGIDQAAADFRSQLSPPGPIEIDVSQPPTPTTCSGGQYWNGAQCVCPSGQQWDGQQCVTPQPPTTCSGGQYWNGAQCVCPSGQQWNGQQCVTTPPPQTTQLPDLTVSRIITDPSSPTPNDVVHVSAVIVNQGSNAPSSVANLYVDGGLFDSANVMALQSGGTVSVTFTRTWTATQGVHSFCVRADATNIVQESNEENNDLCITTSAITQPSSDCPYTVVSEAPEGQAITIRLCPSEVQKIKELTPIEVGNPITSRGGFSEASSVAFDVYTLQLGRSVLSATKGITIEPRELGREIVTFVQNAQSADGSTKERIQAAIGETALSDLVDMGVDVSIDTNYGGFLLWLEVQQNPPDSSGYQTVTVQWLMKSLGVFQGKLADYVQQLVIQGLLTAVQGSRQSSGNLAVLNEPGAKLYLHIYDMQGRHVGVNPDGTVATDIPGAYYYDIGRTTVTLLPTALTDFRLVVDASKAQEPNEQYSLGLLSLTENSASAYAVVSTIDKGKSVEHQVAMSSSQILIDQPQWEIILIRLFGPVDVITVVASAVVTALIVLASSEIVIRRRRFLPGTPKTAITPRPVRVCHTSIPSQVPHL
jgi:hypothetical protein